MAITGDLIKRSVDGDINACDQLLRNFDKQITSFANKITHGNLDLADEIAQLSRVKIANKISTFRNDCNITSWMYLIIKRTYLDHIRKKECNDISLEHLMCATGTDNSIFLSENDTLLSDIISSDFQKSLKNLVLSKLEELPIKNQTVLRKYYFDDKTYDQISKDLEIPIGTVRSRMSIGKNLFASKVETEYRELVCN